MATAASLPRSLNPARETDRFLFQVKKRAAKFRPTQSAGVQAAAEAAYWLFVYRRPDAAVEVCRFVGKVQFTGRFNLWGGVEQALTLQSRLARQRGRTDESAECLSRITEAGFVRDRLRGLLLRGRRSIVKNAVKAGDKTLERDGRLWVLTELVFMIELGGSKRHPVSALERELHEHLTSLRRLLNIAEQKETQPTGAVQLKPRGGKKPAP